MLSKPSYTKFSLGTCYFLRVKSFATFRIEGWCLDLAYVDKLGKDNKEVKFLPVIRDLFNRTSDAEGMKTTDSKNNCSSICKYDYKKESTQKNLVDKRTKDAGEFEKVCSAEGIPICHTKSETKAAFPDRTTGYLKIVLYCYLEVHGYQYVHKMSQKVTALNSRKKCSIDQIPKNVMNSDFLSILYSKPQPEFRKPKCEIGVGFRN